MSRVLMCKTPQGWLMPTDVAAGELMGKLRMGQDVWVDVVRARSTAFHRKYFALLGIGFEAWEPAKITTGEHAGIRPEKDFESFRKDVVKLCGFVDVNVSLDGSTMVTARSISFERMGADEFERLYSETINILLKFVVRNKSEQQLRDWVDAVMRFDT
ncbi:MAG: DUF1367 family protein [Pseudomonadota bacterium]